MPQLHFYVPEKLAARLRERARGRGASLSRYIAELVRGKLEAGWPEGFFEEVVGCWKGEPLARAPQGALEQRRSL